MDPVDQLYGKFMGKLKHEATKLKREAKRIAELETDLEKSLREATSNQNWGCPNSVLYELALACQNYSERQKILKKCWERLASKEDKWRRVLKTLILLDYLLKNGPEQVIFDIQGEQTHFRKLLSFKAVEDGQDRGGAIRDRARNIMDLLSDRDRLNEEREKSKEHQSKFRQGSQMPSSSESRGGGGRAGSAVASIANSLGLSSGNNANAGGISRNKFEERFNELKQKKDKEREDRGYFDGADSLQVADEESPDGNRRGGRRDDDGDRRGKEDSRQRGAAVPKVAAPGSASRNSGLPAASVSGSDDSDDGGERPASAPPLTDLLDMVDGPAPAASSPVSSAPPPPPPRGPAGPSVGLLPPPGAARVAPAASASGGGGLDDLLGETAATPAAPAAASPSDDLFGDSMFQGAAPAAGGGGAAGANFFPGTAVAAPALPTVGWGGPPQEDLFGGFQGTAASPPAFQAAAPQPSLFPAAGFPAPMPAPAPAAFLPMPPGGGMSPAAQQSGPLVGEDLMSKNLRELNLTGDGSSGSGQGAAAAKGPAVASSPKSLDVGDAFQIALGGGR